MVHPLVNYCVSMRAARTILALLFVLLSPAGPARASGLPPGAHTVPPKYLPKAGWFVTNYTPLSFDFRIEHLTPDGTLGLWYSVGPSIQHLDSTGAIKRYAMPHAQWRVSGIARVGTETWFTAGQSGKLGIVDSSGRLTFAQVVPRANFPDLRDLVVNSAREMWFVDAGRSSIGYRSAAGRVVEEPLPKGGYPLKMRRCAGRLWVLANTKGTVLLGIVGGDLRVRSYRSELFRYTSASDIACDSEDRLWMTLHRFAPRKARSFARMLPEPLVMRIERSRVATFHIEGDVDGALASDGAAGMWLTSSGDLLHDLTLLHIAKDGKTFARDLRFGQYAGSPTVQAPDGTLWVGVSAGNSPIAIAALRRK